MNYEDLRKYQRMERNASSLAELDPKFYSNLNELIKEYKEKYESTRSIEDAKVLDNIQKIALDIFERREIKILSKAIKSARSGVKEDKLVEIEIDLFDKTVCLVKENRVYFEKALIGNGFDTPVKSPLEQKINAVEKEMCKSEDLNRVLVRILQNIPKFVSVDGSELGPFESNQIVRLPLKAAQLLVDKSFAEQM